MKPIIKIGELKLFKETIVGITLFPYIFLRKSYTDKITKKYLDTLIRHETIHIHQQIEMLVILFYVWYGIEYFLKLFIYGSEAYYNLSFEREAFWNEENSDYLKTRTFWSFMKYL